MSIVQKHIVFREGSKMTAAPCHDNLQSISDKETVEERDWKCLLSEIVVNNRIVTTIISTDEKRHVQMCSRSDSDAKIFSILLRICSVQYIET